MAEVLTVISIIANIIALIDFSTEIYGRAQNFSDDIRDVPRAFREVRGRLPLVKLALQKTQERVKLGQIGDSEALQQTLSSCLENIQGLNDIFKDVLPHVGASRWTRGWKAVSSLGQDKRVETIDKALMSSLNVLNYYHSTEGATAMQVSEAFKSLTIKAEDTPRKPLFMVRYQKEEEFIGRGTIMEEIQRKFETGTRRVAIAGIGGVGKSRIAIEYCYQYREQNPNSDVFWVHGGTKDRMEAAYKEIAAKMEIPGFDEPTADTLKLVSDWLSEERSYPWLMVLDNADNAEIWTGSGSSSSSDSSETPVPLAKFLPRGSYGSILITTRNIQIGKALTRKKPTYVPIFSSDDAVSLLRSRILDDEVTDEDAKELTESLDFLPLAITQAAAYLDQNDIGVAKYLALVRSCEANPSDLLSRENYDDSRDPDIHNAVFQTWKVSFDQIAQQAPRAAEAVSLMAMLDRQAVSADLLRHKDEKELAFTEAIQKLKAYSLIIEEAKDRTYGMHRIVQLSIQWQLEKENKLQYWQEKALAHVHACFPKDGGYESWTLTEVLNPHAQVVLGYEFTEGHFQLQKANLMFVLGRYHGEHGFYSVAIKYFSDSAEHYAKHMGLENNATLKAMRLLAFTLGENMQYEEGERVICKAMAISDKAFPGKPNPDLLNVYALILSKKENYREAENLFQQALAVDPDNPYTMHNLAVLYKRKGEFGKAENLLWEVLTIKLKSHAQEHPSILTTMERLAQTLGDQHKFEEQEKLAREVLLLRSKVIGLSGPMTLRSMHNLAVALEESGKFCDAYDLFKETLRLRKKVLGIENPETLLTMSQLAWAMHKLGRYDEAEEYFRETLRLETKVLGTDHKDTLTTMHNLALTLEKLEKFEQSEELYRETLKLRTKVLGDDHERTLKTMHALALTLFERGKYQESENLEKEALRLRTMVLGADHNDTLVTMYNLVRTLEELEKYEEAKEIAEKCVELNISVYGYEHSDTLDIQELLGDINNVLESKDPETRDVSGKDPEISDQAVLEPGDGSLIPEEDLEKETHVLNDMNKAGIS